MDQFIVLVKSFLFFLLVLPVVVSAQESIGSLEKKTDPFLSYRLGEFKKAMFDAEGTCVVEWMARVRYESRDSVAFAALEQWLLEQDEHPLLNEVKFVLSRSAFLNNREVTFLSDINVERLSAANQRDFYFIQGHALVAQKQYRSAIEAFEKSVPNTLNNESGDFVTGYAYYYLNEYEKALSYFEQSLQNADYRTSSQFFIACIYSEQEKYEEVIEVGNQYTTDQISVENALFHELVGDAYIESDNVRTASRYFSKALDLHPDPSPSLFYKNGVVRFRLGNEEAAIEYFQNGGMGETNYAYLSAYQLGKIYLNNGAYQQAENAFREAAKSGDDAIRAESFYHISRISAHLGNYNATLLAAFTYLEDYSDGQFAAELHELVAESYLRSSNYELAIEYLEGLETLTPGQAAVYQKVTFLKAQLKLNDLNLTDAKSFLIKSLKYPNDKILLNECYYLLGEIALADRQYRKALDWYLKQSIISPDTWYGIGYCYYHLSEYKEAIEAFNNHLSIGDKYLIDSRLRLSDCYYVTKSYQLAEQGYLAVRSPEHQSYVKYQLGLINKEQDDLTKASNYFGGVDKESAYYAPSLYELGLVAQKQGNFSVAETYFNQFIHDFDNYEAAVQVYLNRAVCKTNLGRYRDAADDYLHILQYYIQSEEAISALLGLQELSSGGLQIKNLDREIARFKNANPDNASIESVEFNIVKKYYFELDYEKAIAGLRAFIDNYPTSPYLTEATFYLGESFYRIGDFRNAVSEFEKLRKLKNAYSYRVLRRLGEIYSRLQEYDTALHVYQELKEVNSSPEDVYNARYGLLETFLELKNFERALSILNEIEKSEWKPYNIEETILINRARCLMGLERYEEAKAEFVHWIDENSSRGAEARFNLAKIEFNQTNYDQALDRLFSLNAEMGSFTEWIDRSYLLIATIYIAKEEFFQAKATLNSIITFSKDENTRLLARQKLQGLDLLSPSDSSKQNDQ